MIFNFGSTAYKNLVLFFVMNFVFFKKCCPDVQKPPFFLAILSSLVNDRASQIFNYKE